MRGVVTFWTLNPAVLLAKNTEADGVSLYAVIGPGVYARRKDDP